MERCHRIKICGLMSREDAGAVNEAGADFAGMVFAPTRHQVDESTAAAIRKTLRADIPAVGVFVNEDPARICALAKKGVIDMIQLHGEESREQTLALKQATGLPVIKAFRIRSREDIKKARGYDADYYLFDTYVKDSYGGTGRTFDWNWLQESDRPFFLAGGLREENIRAATELPAFALDISSGVETEGKKDRNKILAVTAAVKGSGI